MEIKNYSLGLDIGTNSVGWALVDENNQLVKKNGFTFWGVRMFDEASTAKDRRQFRSSRKRIARREKRIALLQKEFKEEIEKVDKNFFQRINDSFLKQEDKKLGNYYTFFDDYCTDKDYFDHFPTIYHLRDYLMKVDKKVDIRMLYLALHHIIKYRGHFLNEGENFEISDVSSIINAFKELNIGLAELASNDEDNEAKFVTINEDNIDNGFIEEFKEIYNSKESKYDKKEELRKLFKVDKSSIAYELIIELLISKKRDISKLSLVKNNKYEKLEIDLASEELETNINEAKDKIPELALFYDNILNIKLIVDYMYLVELLGESNSLSESMVKQYEKHEAQLEKFKILIKKYAKDKYSECFRKVKKDLNNYPAYIGMNSCNSQNKEKKSIKRFSHCKKEDFYDYVKKLLSQIKDESAQQEIEEIKQEIENDTFLLKQRNGQNTVIPMQLHLNELDKILENQSKYYSFLNESDGKLTAKERIRLIFTYHIPYYVGPLGKQKENQEYRGWLVKKQNVSITPFNYKDVIDMDETAKKFIERMQNKCTYLHGLNDYCLPKASLLFSEYNCLSYLNKLKVNGSLISIDLRDDIFNNIFLNYKNPKKKTIKEYLINNYNLDKDLDIPEVNCNMNSYITFKEIFGEDFESNYNLIEDIIKDITIFEDKKIVERRLKEIYNLDDEKVKAIKNLNYKGYGALSRKLLSELKPTNRDTGEQISIIELMRETNLNLQEILNLKEYGFMDAIDEYNKEQSDQNYEDWHDYIEDNIYTSPMMKRGLVQSYTIIEEIEKIIKQPISKYYVECTRTNKAKKEETKSRVNKTIDLYNDCIKKASDFKEYQVNILGLKEKLNKIKENPDQALSDKIYLYFTQLGKCMYTLQDIDFDDVLANKYDIDHIYPQSIIKDDSFSNRVLCSQTFNQITKKDKFLFEIPNCEIYDSKHEKFYSLLKDKGLITKEKYRRLTQKEMTNNELEGFVNRQIVSTNQAVKGLIQLLKTYKNVKASDIIYSKAEVISDFRTKYDFVKSRDANNYHHAHDAYLNVVIGRAINNYYIYNHFNSVSDIPNFKDNKMSINPMTILSKDIKTKNGKVIWDKEKTLKILNENIKERFDIHETIKTKSSGTMLSKVTINPAGNGTVKVKDNLPIDKYGGISSYSYCMYCILKLVDKKDKVSYVLEAIPGAFRNNIELYLSKNPNFNKYKLYEVLNSGIKTNCIVEYNSLKYCITGVSGNQFLCKNAIDRNFDYSYIKIIKKISKYFDNLNNKIESKFIDNKVIISKSIKNKPSIELTTNECDDLFSELIKKFSQKIYAYSLSQSIIQNKDQYYKLNLKDKIFVSNEILKLLKTNERKTANLELIGMSKYFGTISLCELKLGMKFISESITGYYKKVIFEVPSGI